MKKFIAVLLAVLCVMSSFAVASFAEDKVVDKSNWLTCDFCKEQYENATKLQEHLDATFPTEGHKKVCDYCKTTFTTKAAYTAHLSECKNQPVEEKEFKCDYCGKTFSTTAAIKTHIEETFPVVGHCKECKNWTDKNCNGVKDEGECCGLVFTTRVAYDAHAAVCSYKDTRSNFDKMKVAFKNGNYGEGFKYLFEAIAEFVKSDDFKNIFDKVVAFFKSIKLDDIKSTITSLAGKIPFDKLSSLISTDKITGLIKK